MEYRRNTPRADGSLHRPFIVDVVRRPLSTMHFRSPLTDTQLLGKLSSRDLRCVRGERPLNPTIRWPNPRSNCAKRRGYSAVHDKLKGRENTSYRSTGEKPSWKREKESTTLKTSWSEIMTLKIYRCFSKCWKFHDLRGEWARIIGAVVLLRLCPNYNSLSKTIIEFLFLIIFR